MIDTIRSEEHNQKRGDYFQLQDLKKNLQTSHQTVIILLLFFNPMNPLNYNHFDPIFSKDRNNIIDLSRHRSERSYRISQPIPIAQKYPVLVRIERWCRRRFLASSKYTRFNI